MAEMKGLQGGIARCCGLPKNGNIRGGRGTAAVDRNPRGFSMYEGRGWASMSCLSLPGNGRGMRDRGGCHEMPECIVEGGKGEYIREVFWSAV